MAGAVLALRAVPPALATPEALAVALADTFGERPLQAGRVRIEVPQLSEDGNVVPVTIAVDSPMSAEDHVRAIHLFAEKNNLPRVIELRLTPAMGRARVATRIRLSASQRIQAVAEMNDGSLWTAAAEVEVTNAGCGL
jgi:sulfur-oxidizing protein SoxY